MADPQVLLEAFGNRVSRRHRHLRRSLRQADTDCFRVYDRDIPEMAFVLDVYGARALLQQYARSEAEVVPGWLDEVAQRTAEALGIAPDAVARRLRLKVDRRVEQHEKLARERREFEVHEGGLRFLVDLDRYLDTGLFLDHRPLRRHIRECAAGRRFLNLFSYTGSFTVHAAAGGAVSTTSVDLSNTYLDWAARNMGLNGFAGPQHRGVRADVRTWLAEARTREERFDLIVADPPAFSSSKMMQGVFDVQRDHRALLLGCAGVLAEAGELYFSTNLRGFVFEANMPGYVVEDISQKTIPEDFRNRSVHRCWRIRRS